MPEGVTEVVKVEGKDMDTVGVDNAVCEEVLVGL